MENWKINNQKEFIKALEILTKEQNLNFIPFLLDSIFNFMKILSKKAL